jgi:tagatose kinase
MSEIWTIGEILVEIMRPRPGMPLFELGEFLGPFPSGAPAIFIDAAARLGHAAGIVGGVGEDDFGRCVVGRLAAHGVCTDLILAVPGQSTAVAFVTYFKDGSRRFIFHIAGTPAVSPDASAIDRIGDCRLLHVMGCSLMPDARFRDTILETVTRLHARGARISFDPNIRPELLGTRDISSLVAPILERCSLLLPGRQELALLSGRETPAEGVKALFDRTPIEIVALKSGRAGCTLYSRRETIDLPAFEIEEVDPTGAGDCFDAGFVCGYLEGRDLRECGLIAAAAGALNARAFGPMEGDVSRSAVDSLIKAGAKMKRPASEGGGR